MSLTTFGRILYNILPYYITKKLILKYTGDSCFLKFKRSTSEYSGRVHEIDFGEFLFVGDKEEFLKKKARLEKALKVTQEKLDELEGKT
ncbi:hypothetical protein M0R72_18395 [Candidatus Pacearchaeota archaeon]|jgi:hypothetical protein|nr:hypothetical protein [Candidatus Pacearchaeota archaeon]